MFPISRKELFNTLLVVTVFMGIGLACVDRMIGNPAALPTVTQH